MSLDPRLAQLVCARLCHDLGGTVSTIGGMLDLLDNPDAEVLALAQEATAELRGRLKLYAAAWGQAAEPMAAAALTALLAAAPAAARVRFLAEPFVPTALPAPLVPLALNAALLGAEAVARGGTVRLAGGAAEGLSVWVEGRIAAWPAELLAALAGNATAGGLEFGPRHALVPLLLAQAAQAGWEVSLGLGMGPGAAPLLLSPT